MIGTPMKIDRESGIQTRNCSAHVTRVTDRGFDLLRAHARNRSIWAVRIQRVREIVTTVVAIVLGSVAGWLLMR